MAAAPSIDIKSVILEHLKNGPRTTKDLNSIIFGDVEGSKFLVNPVLTALNRQGLIKPVEGTTPTMWSVQEMNSTDGIVIKIAHDIESILKERHDKLNGVGHGLTVSSIQPLLPDPNTPLDLVEKALERLLIKKLIIKIKEPAISINFFYIINSRAKLSAEERISKNRERVQKVLAENDGWIKTTVLIKSFPTKKKEDYIRVKKITNQILYAMEKEGKIILRKDSEGKNPEWKLS